MRYETLSAIEYIYCHCENCGLFCAGTSHVNSTEISRNHESPDSGECYTREPPIHDQTIKDEPHVLQEISNCLNVRDRRERCRCMQPPAKYDDVGSLFEKNAADHSSSFFSFFSSFNTAFPCAKLAVRSCSGTFLCTRF